jgi:hypothetical protein
MVDLGYAQEDGFGLINYHTYQEGKVDFGEFRSP